MLLYISQNSNNSFIVGKKCVGFCQTIWWHTIQTSELCENYNIKRLANDRTMQVKNPVVLVIWL